MSSAASESHAIPASTLWLMTIACGAAVANIYYHQPLLGIFAREFHASEGATGLVAMAAQTGYGLGLLFFVPLGDLLERRRLIFQLIFACVGCLVFTALAPSLPLLIAAQFLTGLTATSAQIIIPLSLEVAPAGQRGKIVGLMMAGVLCGILLARMVSGFVAVWLGWRAIFWFAAAFMVLLAFALRSGLPHRPPTLRLSYPALMRTLLHLSVEQPRIWPSSLVSALSFACFTALWTTLSFLMQSQFHRGAGETGLFGLIGLVGALAAPLMGRLTDRRGPAFTLTLCLLMTAFSFALMWQWITLWSLVVGVLFMDLGVQSIQVAAQSKVITLVAAARSRLNTIYMVLRFIGGAAGSAAGAFAWVHSGWSGVCLLALALLGLALTMHLVGTHREKLTTEEGRSFNQR